jgi:hypothetical protein
MSNGDGDGEDRRWGHRRDCVRFDFGGRRRLAPGVGNGDDSDERMVRIGGRVSGVGNDNNNDNNDNNNGDNNSNGPARVELPARGFWGNDVPGSKLPGLLLDGE